MKIEQLNKCTVCPNNCNVNRNNGQKGICNLSDEIKIAMVSKHYYEEPPISGTKGSGTIFFSHCNLNCIYCQNYDISANQNGKIVSIRDLANIMLEQQSQGVHNINLVTPTMYAYQIIEAIKIAKANGLKIPIVYNTNGYESVKTIKDLNGYIDIYLTDLKYSDNNLSKEYSNVNKYFDVTTQAIKEMQKQINKIVIDKDGIMQKGIIIRHLILPNAINNTKNVLNWIKENNKENTIISIMSQYFPSYKAKQITKLNRKITKQEYEEIENYLFKLNLENGYIQDYSEDNEEEYVPDFKSWYNN